MELMAILLVVALVAVLISIFLWSAYTSLLKAHAQIDEDWDEVKAQLKTRADLIPHLIEAVKKHTTHEKNIFESVTQACAETVSAQTPKSAAQAENQMQIALKSMFAVAEGYPHLQANQTFLTLQAQLVDAENKIQTARRSYNGGIGDFNAKIQGFPGSMFAKRVGLSQRQVFDVQQLSEVSEPPRIQF